MNARAPLLFAVLFATCACATASAQPRAPRPDSLFFFPAGRLVGEWLGEITIGPCAGGPKTTFAVLGTFNAGGTLGYTNASIPPTAAGPTFGTWDYVYDRASHGLRYRARMQFYRYRPDGSIDGVQDIHRTITLDSDARQMFETVVADVLNADGSLRVRLCGGGSSQRVAID